MPIFLGEDDDTRKISPKVLKQCRKRLDREKVDYDVVEGAMSGELERPEAQGVGRFAWNSCT